MDDPWAAPWSTPAAKGNKSPAPPRMSLSPPPDDDVDPWGPPVPKPSAAPDLPSLDALAPRRSEELPTFDSALPSWGGEWGATPKKASPPVTSTSPTTSPTLGKTSLGSPTLGKSPPKSPLQIPLPRSPSPDAVEQSVEAAWGGDDVVARMSQDLARPSLTLSRPGTVSPVAVSRTTTPQLNEEREDEEEEEPPSPGQALERELDVISPQRSPSPKPIVEDEVRGFPSPETAMRAALGDLDDYDKLPDLDTLMVKEPPRDTSLGLAGLEASDIVRRSMSPSSDFGGFGSPERGVRSDDPWGTGADEPWGAAVAERERERESTPSPSRQEKQWEIAQSEMRLRDELAPFEKIQSLKKEWDGVAAAVLGDNEPTVSEDEERKLDAAASALKEHSADTLRSLTVIPDTTVPLQTQTGAQLARALARPNPTPQSSLLYAPNVRRRPLGPGLESRWAQRSRLGEPDVPAESRPSLESSQGSRWSFWRKQAAPPKPLVTSGGGMLERKSDEPSRPSAGSRPASISSIPTPATSSQPETPTARSATPTIPEDAVASTPTITVQPAPQQQGSRMSRIFGWGKKKAPEEPSSAGAKEDLELTTDDFAFLAEVPSHTPPGSADLLGMDGPTANLEQVLNAPKAVPLPAPLAPPPGAPRRSDSGGFVARMAPAHAPTPSATDLLSGLDFDAPPPPASKPSTSSSSSLWDDFLEPAKPSPTTSTFPSIQPPKLTSPAIPTLGAPPKSSSPLSAEPMSAGFPTLTPTPPASSPVTGTFSSLVPSRPSTPKSSLDTKPPAPSHLSQSSLSQSNDFGFGDLSLSPPKPSPISTHATSDSISSQKQPSARAYGPSGGLGGAAAALPPRARYGPSGPARGSISALPPPSAPSPASPAMDSPPQPRKLTKGPTGYGKLNAVGSPSPERKVATAPPPFGAGMEPLRPTPSPSPSPSPATSQPMPPMAPMAPMAPSKPLQPMSAQSANDDFGDFGDFGDFSAPTSAPAQQTGLGTFTSGDDDFGDFGDFTSFAAPTAAAAPATPARIQSAAPTPPFKSSVPPSYRQQSHGTPSKTRQAPPPQISVPKAGVAKHLPPAQMKHSIELSSSFAIPTLAPPPGTSKPKPAQQENLLGDDFGDFADFAAPVSGPPPPSGNSGVGFPSSTSASALANLSASAGSGGSSPRKVDHAPAAELVHAAAQRGPAQWPSTSPIKALAPPPGSAQNSRPASFIDLMDE